MIKYLPFFLLFISSAALADPGIICYSNLDHSVQGCNCPGTCVGKNLVIGSQVGGCETKVSCDKSKHVVIKAEKEPELTPYPVTLTVFNLYGSKLYYELLYLPFNVATQRIDWKDCVGWDDLDGHQHLICSKDNLIMHYEEVGYEEGEKQAIKFGPGPREKYNKNTKTWEK